MNAQDVRATLNIQVYHSVLDHVKLVCLVKYTQAAYTIRLVMRVTRVSFSREKLHHILLCLLSLLILLIRQKVCLDLAVELDEAEDVRVNFLDVLLWYTY